MPTDLDVLVDELYALPLERFVPERDVLAKQLRSEGRREDAARVAALTKPSIVAWAVNQVVRAQPAAAEALWTAGDAVLDTQSRVVAGEATGPELRASIEAERAALAPLADAARGLMTGSGRFLGEQNVQPVMESLHAAAIDPAVRPQVAAGRLTRPLRLTGLEATLATGGSPSPRRQEEPAADRERLKTRRRSDAVDEDERRRTERERRARRQEAERALVRAERDRDKARERIAAAVRDRDTAQAELTAAQQRLDAAEAELGGAEERLATAHGALEDAEEVVDRARREVEEA
jgi:hypothetical protein